MKIREFSFDKIIISSVVKVHFSCLCRFHSFLSVNVIYCKVALDCPRKVARKSVSIRSWLSLHIQPSWITWCDSGIISEKSTPIKMCYQKSFAVLVVAQSIISGCFK